MKNKTLTVYLALLFGVFGVHRLYLKGWRDVGAWLHLLTTGLGLIGLRRIFALGQDDQLSWLLAPFFGFSLFAACLSAIVYGLMLEAKWNKAYNKESPESPIGYGLAGSTSGVTIIGVILSLLIGATALMSAIAYTGQRSFEMLFKSAAVTSFRPQSPLVGRCQPCPPTKPADRALPAVRGAFAGGISVPYALKLAG